MKASKFVLASLLLVLAAGIAGADANLPNFATVHPGLMRGAAPTPAGLAQLKSMGVTTVVDLRIAPKMVAREKAEVLKMGMKFVNIPLGSDPPTKRQVQQWLAIANTATPQAAVYVHCQHGADRTGEMCGIYREVHDGWTFKQAYTEMLHYGFKPYYTKLAANVRSYGKS